MFNVVFAFERTQQERGDTHGRAVAQSSFRHFADCNWDIDKGCPSFVDEPLRDAVKSDPAKLNDIKADVRNLALWLAPVKRQ